MAVEVTLGKVGLDGYLVDGHATISTDGFKETFDTRLSLANFGIVTFRGAMERDGATVTLDGVGSWRGTELSTPPTSDGWRCVSAPQSALSFRKVHRTTSDCYGDRGMLVVTRPYACVGEDDAGAPARSNLVATSNVVFLPTTPATGNVTISVSLPGGAADVSAAPAATPLPAQVCQSRGKGAG
jgi:hypothetical protein